MSAVPITGETGVHEYGLAKNASLWLLVSRIKRFGSHVLRQL